jgi:hypothetical protein
MSAQAKTLKCESGEEPRDALLIDLSEAQKVTLERIEDSLCAKMHLKRSHLFGIDGCRANVQLQQSVMYIASRHPLLVRDMDWLGGYFGYRPWQVHDFIESVEYHVGRSPHSEFARQVIGVWREVTG